MGKIADRALEILEEKFIAASGPGGQNVNKVATAVQLRVDVFQLGMPPEAFNRLKELAALLNEALTPPPKRAKSRVNRVGKVKRLKAKKTRGEVKANRGKVDW